MKNSLEKKCSDLQEFANMSNEDLKAKIISMKEVNDLLYKQLQESDHQKLEFESKLIKLQTAFNDQLEEEKKEIMRLYKNKKNKENREISFVSGDEDTNKILSGLEIDGKETDSLRNKMSLLYNENKSLKEVVKDLKKEVIDLKNKNSLNNKAYNLIGTNVNVQKVDGDNEKVIEDLMLECNKWKKEYSTMFNENNVLKKYVSKLEKNLGIDEQMDNLRTLLAEKDQLLVNLSYQIKEYQSKIDNIIIGKTEESKDRQIQILLNEVKGIRKRILNIVTLNDRITNFDEFIEAINCIKQLESKNKDKKIEKAFDQLTYLMEIYQQNNDKAYSKFVNEIYGEGSNVNNLINFDEIQNNDNNFDNNNNNGNNYNNNNNFNNGNNNYNENYNNNNFNGNYNNNFNNDIYNDNNDENYNNNYNNNDQNNINNDNNNEDYFDTDMNNNNDNNNNNDINFNTGEYNDGNNNYNNNDNNNDFNDDNNFGNDNNNENAFDDINFDEFENEEEGNNNGENNNNNQNNQNNNNNNNNQNNNNNNNDDDDYDEML